MHFWRGTSLTIVMLALAAGCASGNAGTDGVRAIGAGESASERTASQPADRPGATVAPHPTDPTGAGSPSTTAPPAADESDRRTVQQVLDRYDRAVTALNADPSAIMRPGDALVTGLDAVVPPASVLAADVRSAVAERLAAGERVRPPRGGALSWLHHTTATAGPDGDSDSGEITFEWCSWSPGVAVDTTSGSVTDDSVGHATGTGTVALAGADWTLTSLDQTSLEVLPAGSPDPCPGAPR